MKQIGYVLKRVANMDYAAMCRTLEKLHGVTGRSRVALLWDVQRCAVRYGAGYTDYQLFELYRLTPAQRDTYLTRGRNNQLVRRYNDPSFYSLFDDKAEFYELFSSFLHREWISTKAPEWVMEAFIHKHGEVIIKPCGGMCGKGIRKFRVTDHDGVHRLSEELAKQQETALLEQVIVQHTVLERLYPSAVNTARIVTIRKDNTTHIICAYLRIGNNGAAVDNFNSGGMVAPIDEPTGVVRDAALDKQKQVYERHPMTGTAIRGLALPDWEQAVVMVREASAVVPQMGYIGWDVAFTPDGPCLVEGNNFPGHDIYQLPAHTPDGIGMWRRFQV